MSYPREPVQQIYFVIYWAQAVPKAVFQADVKNTFVSDPTAG